MGAGVTKLTETKGVVESGMPQIKSRSPVVHRWYFKGNPITLRPTQIIPRDLKFIKYNFITMTESRKPCQSCSDCIEIAFIYIYKMMREKHKTQIVLLRNGYNIKC